MVYCDLCGRIKCSARSLNYVLYKLWSMDDNERTISHIQYSTVGNVFMFEYDDRRMVHFCTNTIFPELHANTIQRIVQITKAEIALIEQVEWHLVHAKDLLKSC